MSRFGSGNHKASKLTPMLVMEMRDKYATGKYTQPMLSREYLVSLSTVRNIVNGTTWQKLPMATDEEAEKVEAKLSENRVRALLALGSKHEPAEPNVLDRLTQDIAAKRNAETKVETDLDQFLTGDSDANL